MTNPIPLSQILKVLHLDSFPYNSPLLKIHSNNKLSISKDYAELYFPKHLLEEFETKNYHPYKNRYFILTDFEN